MRHATRETAGPWPDSGWLWMTGAAAYAGLVVILVLVAVPPALAAAFALPVVALAMFTVHARSRWVIALGAVAVLASVAVIVMQHETLHAHEPSEKKTAQDHEGEESVERAAAEAAQAAIQPLACGPAYLLCSQAVQLLQAAAQAERTEHRAQHNTHTTIHGTDQEVQRDRWQCWWETRHRIKTTWIQVTPLNGATYWQRETEAIPYQHRVCGWR